MGEPRPQSHAWLAQDGLLVDITADQFPGMLDPVIVTRELPALHASFKRRIEHEADYRIYDAHTVATLDVMYRKIMAAMETENGRPRTAPPFGAPSDSDRS